MNTGKFTNYYDSTMMARDGWLKANFERIQDDIKQMEKRLLEMEKRFIERDFFCNPPSKGQHLSWISVEDEEMDIPINTNLLITDGYEVFIGFYDSMLDWRMADQELCDCLQFHVSHWMEFPNPPCK